VLDTLRVARTLQAEAQLRAQTARDEARTTFTQVQSDKLSLERSATQAQSVLQQLQVKQAQLVQAAKDAAARQAAQTRAAALAAEARANAASLAAFRAQAAAVVPQAVTPTPTVSPVTSAPAVTPANPAVHAVGSAASIAVQTALAQVGKPYVYGAAGPTASTAPD